MAPAIAIAPSPELRFVAGQMRVKAKAAMTARHSYFDTQKAGRRAHRIKARPLHEPRERRLIPEAMAKHPSNRAQCEQPRHHGTGRIERNERT